MQTLNNLLPVEVHEDYTLTLKHVRHLCFSMIFELYLINVAVLDGFDRALFLKVQQNCVSGCTVYNCDVRT